QLFYDLWFVANLEVFSSVHEVTQNTKLYSYMGYLTILWFTWFLVGLFDVRYVTDSIFERLARTVHLGVMVGFAVVASRFHPDSQIKSIFQGLSIILMVSRLVLVVQYAAIIWHVRHFKDGKWPLTLVAVSHFLFAIIYFGLLFGFNDGQSPRIFIAWYVIAACEALLNLGLALKWKVLSFAGTHLTERMTLLTLIILGEGVITIAKNVVLIVKNQGWTSVTMGILTAAITTVYIFFMIYFDWMNHHHMTGIRQLLWTILHFPFHVALLLFMEGATQFITWWKLLEVQDFANDEFMNVAAKLSTHDNNITSEDVAHSLNDTVNHLFKQYPATYQLTINEIANILQNIGNITNWFWSSNETGFPEINQRFTRDIDNLFVTVINSIFVNFKVDPFEDNEEVDPVKMQYKAYTETNNRFILVFQYTYTTAGITLIVMTMLYVLTKRQGLTPYNILRTSLFLVLGIGLSLVTLVSIRDSHGRVFIRSPWLLPTLCIVFLCVLILTHLPKPPPLI
ncbi:uncharacterized protein BCR38DRAFT_294854, partial [Pseudomassariella vexata]